MDYIISEGRLVKLIDNYITQKFGELTKRDSSHVMATEGDFELVDKDGNVMFEFIDHNLGVSQPLFNTIGDLFNKTFMETENIFVRWFEKKFPGELILAAYCSVSF